MRHGEYAVRHGEYAVVCVRRRKQTFILRQTIRNTNIGPIRLQETIRHVHQVGAQNVLNAVLTGVLCKYMCFLGFKSWLAQKHYRYQIPDKKWTNYFSFGSPSDRRTRSCATSYPECAVCNLEAMSLTCNNTTRLLPS